MIEMIEKCGNRSGGCLDFWHPAMLKTRGSLESKSSSSRQKTAGRSGALTAANEDQLD